MREITESLREEAAFHAYVLGSQPELANELRRMGFWTQKEIAARVGCSRQYIHLLEQTALKKVRQRSVGIMKEYGSLLH